MPWMRLRKLLLILKIEHGLQVDLDIPPIVDPPANFQIEEREDLKRVLFAVKCLAAKLKLSSIKCSFNFPTIYDAGIVVTSQEK
jgi:hypothetical protein